MSRRFHKLPWKLPWKLLWRKCIVHLHGMFHQLSWNQIGRSTSMELDGSRFASNKGGGRLRWKLPPSVDVEISITSISCSVRPRNLPRASLCPYMLVPTSLHEFSKLPVACVRLRQDPHRLTVLPRASINFHELAPSSDFQQLPRTSIYFH